MAEHGGWRTFGEGTIYDSRWVRLGMVDVEAPPYGERWEYHVAHFSQITASPAV